MKQEGKRIFGETCPQYLCLTNQAVLERGPLGKVGPPLRQPEDNEAIWAGLASGIIDTVASDSCNLKAEQKAWGGASQDAIGGREARPDSGNIFEARFGAPSAEQMLPVVYHEGVNCGRITLPRLVQTMCENPAKMVVGAPVLVMQRGEVVVEDGQLKREAGRAKFLPGNRDTAAYAEKGFTVEPTSRV
jgi:dihydroorotase-like cyclic amidohydrolase